MPPIRAVTFDLWDTVLHDDSDEPKRAAQGLPPKPAARRALVTSFLARHGPISPSVVDAAYDAVDTAFRKVWYDQSVTWTVRERLQVLLAGLGRKVPEEELSALVREHEEMELQVQPDLVPGAAEAIARLRGRYRLGVVSDAIFSPGWALRRLLEVHGLLGSFEDFVFSDEVGLAKPDPRVFALAAAALGVEPRELVHVGDREEKDVEGPHRAGARAILLEVVRHRGGPETRAEAVCGDYRELPAILERLEAEP